MSGTPSYYALAGGFKEGIIFRNGKNYFCQSNRVHQCVSCLCKRYWWVLRILARRSTTLKFVGDGQKGGHPWPMNSWPCGSAGSPGASRRSPWMATGPWAPRSPWRNSTPRGTRSASPAARPTRPPSWSRGTSSSSSGRWRGTSAMR